MKTIHSAKRREKQTQKKLVIFAGMEARGSQESGGTNGGAKKVGAEGGESPNLEKRGAKKGGSPTGWEPTLPPKLHVFFFSRESSGVGREGGKKEVVRKHRWPNMHFCFFMAYVSLGGPVWWDRWVLIFVFLLFFLFFFLPFCFFGGGETKGYSPPKPKLIGGHILGHCSKCFVSHRTCGCRIEVYAGGDGCPTVTSATHDTGGSGVC